MKRKSLMIVEKERGLVPGRPIGAQDKVYAAYLDNLKPRDNRDLQIAMASSPDPRFREFLDRISIPRYRRVSLQTIAKACNISLADFNNWWNRESTQRAIAVAQTRSIALTENMANDAMSRDEMCDRCEALGEILAPPGLEPDKTPGYRCFTDGKDMKWMRTCPKCRGIGYMSRPGDTHARDRILEMSGLIQKGKGIAIIQNFGGAAHSSAVSSLDALTIDVDSD